MIASKLFENINWLKSETAPSKVRESPEESLPTLSTGQAVQKEADTLYSPAVAGG